MWLRKWNNGPNRPHWPVQPAQLVFSFPVRHSISPLGTFLGENLLKNKCSFVLPCIRSALWMNFQRGLCCDMSFPTPDSRADWPPAPFNIWNRHIDIVSREWVTARRMNFTQRAYSIGFQRARPNLGTKDAPKRSVRIVCQSIKHNVYSATIAVHTLFRIVTILEGGEFV